MKEEVGHLAAAGGELESHDAAASRPRTRALDRAYPEWLGVTKPLWRKQVRPAGTPCKVSMVIRGLTHRVCCAARE